MLYHKVVTFRSKQLITKLTLQILMLIGNKQNYYCVTNIIEPIIF